MKISVIFLVVTMLSFVSCKRNHFPEHPAKNYPADVAIGWMNMHMRLTRTTPGFNSIVSGRSFSYAGLALYASVAPGIPNGGGVFLQLSGDLRVSGNVKNDLYWPASANAAMASITKKLFGNTSPANIASIDSLENAFTRQFEAKANEEQLDKAEEYGRKVADAVFEWSKTDGGHEAYSKVTSPDYVPPVGDGYWTPTPPALTAPVHPYWGNNRSYILNIANQTQPDPPLPYATHPGTPFYEMVNELYTISLSLSKEDSTITRFWGDLPSNYNVPAHATNIASQLIKLNNFSLDEAAITYAKHGMALNDALISVFKTKYKYTLIRPISYIRGVMGHTTWNTVIPTPSHPEYTAAHAVISSAVATVLEDIFGKNYGFTDHTYDNLYGARSFSSFEDYAEEAAYSRVLGGIHYRRTVLIGLVQGKKVGDAINNLHFKKIKR